MHLKNILEILLETRPELLEQLLDQQIIVKKTRSAVVDYSRPRYAELKAAFGWVDDYTHVKFEEIESCKAVSRKKRKVEFRYFGLEFGTSVEAVLALMDTKNLRPAIYEEITAFVGQCPRNKKIGTIIALGSTITFGHDRFAARYNGQGGLDLFRCDSFVQEKTCFLAVLKSPPEIV